MRAEQAVGIAAETGRDAVDRLLATHLLGEEFGGARDGRKLLLGQFDLRAMRDRDQLRARQRAAIQTYGLHRCASTCGWASSTRNALASSARATSNWSARRRSLTVTVPFPISSSPITTTKRIPARSAYLNCFASFDDSITTSVLSPAWRNSWAIASPCGRYA